MKILIAGFLHETANLSPIKEKEMYCFEGEEITPYFDGALQVFEQQKAQCIKSVFFTTEMGAGGLIDRTAFLRHADKIIGDARRIKNLDAVFLRLHGASDVEDLGQGELYILRGLRDALGYQVPIGVAMDPHGNLSPDIVKYANIIRAYHTAPHRDISKTCHIVASHLVDSLKHNKLVTPVLERVPMLLSGDFAITSIEPTKSIMERMAEYEQDDEIYCASFFISFVFADVDHSYPCVVVVPSDMEYYEKAQSIANQTVAEIYGKRTEFRFDGVDLSPTKAIKQAISLDSPVILSDSGDNPTGGGAGINTHFMEMFLDYGQTNGRKVLFSTIYDPVACQMLMRFKEGSEVDFMLGVGLDEFSKPIRIRGILRSKGRTIKGVMNNRQSTDYGNSVLVTFGDYTVQVTDTRDSLMYKVQLDEANIDLQEYDIIVLKQAYQFEDIAVYGKSHILAYTPGATNQNIPEIRFKKVPKTVFPLRVRG